MKKKVIRNKIIIILLIGCFFFLRLYKIEQRINFSMDQGLFLLRSWDIYQNKEITLIGPTTSIIVHGRQFFQGPLIYYSLILLMLISNWNIIAAACFLVFFNFLALVVLYIAAEKIFNKKIAVITAIFYIFLPVTINFSNFLWNPNFLLILTPFFIFLGAKSLIYKKWWNYLIWGILGGICFQFHFQFALILLFTFLFLIFKKQNIKNIGWFISGALVGYSPLLIFDLRNNFYNIKTILEWLKFGGDEKFGFQIYYFLSFVPFICLGFGWLINKLKNKNFLILLMIIFIGYSFGKVLKQKEAFGMPKGWNYSLQKETIKKILINGCPSDFNVASTLNGDTRAYDLRFLLIRNGCKPMDVDKYPEIKTLFLVAPKERRPENETVWEINSMGKVKIKREEKLNEAVIFYELEKNEN